MVMRLSSRAVGHVIEPTAPRILPELTDLNRPFWTGGARGELLVQRCAGCRRWVHPPTTQCPECGGELRPEPVRGTGTIFTYTENRQQFHPDVPPPYVIAIVTLDEQDDLRLPTNIVHCEVDTLRCGLRVRVLFETHGEVFVPVFEPVPE
jgi:uncharacterized OB-fold protein